MAGTPAQGGQPEVKGSAQKEYDTNLDKAQSTAAAKLAWAYVWNAADLKGIR